MCGTILLEAVSRQLDQLVSPILRPNTLQLTLLKTKVGTAILADIAHQKDIVLRTIPGLQMDFWSPSIQSFVNLRSQKSETISHL